MRVPTTLQSTVVSQMYFHCIDLNTTKLYENKTYVRCKMSSELQSSNVVSRIITQIYVKNKESY